MEDPAHVGFLSQLPLLASLKLECSSGRAWHIPADALLASLLRCSGPTELSLTCGFKSAHWSALFAELTLKKLTIRAGELESLQCFAAGPITQSLEELTLREINVPPSEVRQLYSLRRLRTLHLYYCFSPRLDAAVVDVVSPPTSQLPALTKLVYQWQISEDTQVRKGPSFEWMQARLTQ